MKSHNKNELLKELKSLPYETLSEEQKKTLSRLEELKKQMDDVAEKIPRGSKYYDKNGKPMTMWEWSCYFEDYEYKIVGADRYGDYRVSTVWLGLDHSYYWYEPKPPIEIFETMIFNDEDVENELSDYIERYSTEEQALDGHLEACKLASEASHSSLLMRWNTKNNPKDKSSK